MGKKDPDPPPRCVINDSFSMSCDVKSCQKTKRSLVVLTWPNATTARLFEGVIIKILWCSPCLTAYWVMVISRKYFSLVDELTTKQHMHTPLSCVCCWWCLGVSTVRLRWKLGRHRQCLSKWRRATWSAGTQVGYRLHNATKSSSFHVIFWGVSPLVGVGMFALQMIICVFNFAFSPSVGTLLFSLGSSRPIHI